jgi:hypothetical protein
MEDRKAQARRKMSSFSEVGRENPDVGRKTRQYEAPPSVPLQTSTIRGWRASSCQFATGDPLDDEEAKRSFPHRR